MYYDTGPEGEADLEMWATVTTYYESTLQIMEE
jgi:hypothetical protein